MILFWSNLTPEEADWLYPIIRKIREWVGWVNTPRKKRVGDPPPEPTDEEYILHDRIVAKGWAS